MQSAKVVGAKLSWTGAKYGPCPCPDHAFQNQFFDQDAMWALVCTIIVVPMCIEPRRSKMVEDGYTGSKCDGRYAVVARRL